MIIHIGHYATQRHWRRIAAHHKLVHSLHTCATSVVILRQQTLLPEIKQLYATDNVDNSDENVITVSCVCDCVFGLSHLYCAGVVSHCSQLDVLHLNIVTLEWRCVNPAGPVGRRHCDELRSS